MIHFFKLKKHILTNKKPSLGCGILPLKLRDRERIFTVLFKNATKTEKELLARTKSYITHKKYRSINPQKRGESDGYFKAGKLIISFLFVIFMLTSELGSFRER